MQLWACRHGKCVIKLDVFVSSLFAAPSGVRATAESITEIAVNFPALPSGSPISSFEARIKDGSQKCTANTNVSPLRCVIAGLQAGTAYKILTKASIGGLESDESEISGYTLPDGESSGYSLSCKIYSDDYNRMKCLTPPEPDSIEFVKVSTTTVTVKATPPGGNPAIDAYEATVVGASPAKKCTVKSNVSPLQCEITGLTQNTPYTISLRACMPSSAGCSDAVTGDTRTLPIRMLSFYSTISS